MQIKALILIGLLLIIGTLIVAQEAFTPSDNWCYEGGRWGDGRCGGGTEYEKDWYWTCGWYLARHEAGIFTFDQVPATCRIVFGGDMVEATFTPRPTSTPDPIIGTRTHP